ncbi:MAG: PIG-L family deacetylase [Phycisphaerales bacterium]|nr:PIG-L family deacetylase [Phycisphaerales bacterium]
MNILVIGPHPDDQELGMGGTIAALAEQGHDVLLLDVTNGEPTPFGTPEKRQAEAAAALKILNPNPAWHPEGRPLRRWLLGLANRTVEHTVAARYAVAAVIRAHQSQVIFAPHPEDAHPDHRAVTRIAEDARFDAKLTRLELPDPIDQWTGQRHLLGEPIYPKWFFYYYATHLRQAADPSFIFDITGRLDRKLASIRAYETQFVIPEKNRLVLEWIEGAARYFGSRIGTTAGEPFFTREPVGLTGFDALA